MSGTWKVPPLNTNREQVVSHASSSNIYDEEHALLDEENEGSGDEGFRIRRPDRRRSSVSNRLASMADIGGPNSFRSFTRSWQRAAAFAEVIPRQPSFVYTQEPSSAERPSGSNIQYTRTDIDQPLSYPGLLSQHLEGRTPDAVGEAPTRPIGEHSGSDGTAITEDFRARESKLLDTELASGALPAASSSSRSSLFALPPHLSSPSMIGSYSSHQSLYYGTINNTTQRRRLSIRCVTSDGEVEVEEDTALGEEQPILVKQIKQGDKVVLTVEGESTLPQSIFNSINAIIGVGILGLPLAFKMSGWVLGLGILTLMAAVTAHTGNLLGKCMEFDKSLITYSDIAYISFGPRARVIVSALFTLELLAACVALIILFADSLALLVPTVGSATLWKCVCAVSILALNALPLRWLSYTSVVGIFSTLCIVCIIAFDGLMKPEAPGSLRQPASTYLFPSNWLAIPLAYGLMASPWGAHSVFPSVYRDMRHPHKWKKAVKVTFSFSYILDMCLAVIGLLMFGDNISEAITSDILRTDGYSEVLTIIMCACVTIIPLTKIPLSARPLITTADVLCGVHQDHLPRLHPDQKHTWLLQLYRGFIRIAVVLILLGISILFPAFDSVCAFLGAALCTLISVILPLSFYLKLYWKDISSKERILYWILLVLFSALGTVGTIWTFLPKSLVNR